MVGEPTSARGGSRDDSLAGVTGVGGNGVDSPGLFGGGDDDDLLGSLGRSRGMARQISIGHV